MANLATTIYNIEGNERDINLIAEAFDFADTIYEGLSKLDPDFSSDDEVMGDVLNSGKLADGSYSIVTSTKWERNVDFENALYGIFEYISIFFQEEEFGCGIFRTNDPSFEIFTDRYYADVDCDGEYFHTEKEMLDWLNIQLDTEYDNMEYMYDYINEMRERGECYVTIYECEVE